nr:glycosyltransferase family 39 protein [Paracidobacterium acidisoli]
MASSAGESVCASSRKIAWSVCLSCLLASACLFILLGHKPLADWDEAIYAGVSKEMLSGHFFSPTWRSQHFFEKPPLYMWLTAIFFRLFGITEFWARASSALAGVAIVGILHGLMARARGLRAAWLATLILLTMKGFAHAARVGELDQLLTLGCCLALWGMHRLRGSNLSGWYLVWTGFAIAVMTKSAAAVVIPITLLVLIVWERWPPAVFGKAFFAGAALFLVLAAPWHLYMWHQYGAVFWREYLGVQVFSRSTMQLDRHVNPPWFYLNVLAIYAMPWLFLLPFAIVKGFQKKELREFLIFAFVVLGLFTVAKTRLPQYIVPVYPALVILIADWIYLWFTAAVEPARRVRRFGYGVAFGIVALLASALLARPAAKHLPGREATDPGEKDAQWLLPLLRSESSQSYIPPILLCMDGDWFPLPAAVFYVKQPLQQVYIRQRPDISHEAHLYYDDPRPLNRYVDASPRLVVMDQSETSALPANMVFQQIRQNGRLVIGTIALRSGVSR